MKHFAYPATIFSCVKQPLPGNKRKPQKSVRKHRTAPKPPTTGAPRRRTDSKAHPPPLIRLRFESTSSAPSMATSSCRERRNSVWKPHPHGLKVLLSVKNLASQGTTWRQALLFLVTSWCQWLGFWGICGLCEMEEPG